MNTFVEQYLERSGATAKEKEHVEIATVAGLAEALSALLGQLTTLLASRKDKVDAKATAQRAVFEIAHITRNIFGNDAEFVVAEILGKDHVIESILKGASATQLLPHFRDAYSESDNLTGQDRLIERLEQFVAQSADVLLRLDIRSSQALGNKMDASRAELFQAIEGLEHRLSTKIDRHGENNRAGPDPYSGLRSQVELVESLIGVGKTRGARDAAEHLLARVEANTVPLDLRTQLVSALSGANLYQGNIEEAVRLFEDALAQDEANPSLRLNAATANLLAGNPARAATLATAILSENRRNGHAVGVLIQSRYELSGMESVLDLVASNPWVRADSSAAGAFSMVLEKEDRLTEAEDLIRPHLPDAVESFADAQLILQLALVLSRLATEELQHELPLPRQYSTHVAARLEEAHKHYSSAIEYLETTDYEMVLTNALANRSTVRLLLGWDRLAIADVDRALQMDPYNARLLMNRAQISLAHEDFEAAIADLEKAIGDNQEYGTRSLLGSALLAVGRTEDAILRFEEDLDIAGENCEQRAATLVALLQAHIEVGNKEKADKTRKLLETEAGDEPHVLALFAKIEGTKDPGQAIALYERAITSPVNRGRDIAKAEFANFLMSLGHWRYAGEILQQLVGSGASEIVYRNLALCGLNSGDPRMALDSVKMFGDKDTTTDLKELGAAALEQLGDYKEAASHYRSLLDTRPEDLSLRVRLSRSLLSAGDRSGAEVVLEQVPPDPKRLSGIELMVVASMRQVLGLPDYLDYAWNALRSEPADADIRGGYLQLFAAAIGDKGLPPEPEVIGENTTVTLSLTRGDQSLTTTFERSILPDGHELRHNELNVSDQMAQKLLGKHVGQVLPWGDRFGKPVQATVDRLDHVFTTAFREATRLAGEEGAGRFVEVLSGQPDSMIEDILRVTGWSHESRRSSITKYLRAPEFPLHLLARSLSMGLQETKVEIRKAEHGRIHSFDNDRKAWEFRRSQVSIESSRVVVDATALLTLAELDLLSLLERFEKVLVPASVLMAFNAEIALVAKVLDPHEIPDALRPVVAARTWLESRGVDSVGLGSDDGFQPDVVSAMVEALGQPGADAILLAVKVGLPLLTDDFGLARSAMLVFNTVPLHTRYVISELRSVGAVSDHEYEEAERTLRDLKYASTGELV